MNLNELSKMFGPNSNYEIQYDRGNEGRAQTEEEEDDPLANIDDEDMFEEEPASSPLKKPQERPPDKPKERPKSPPEKNQPREDETFIDTNDETKVDGNDSGPEIKETKPQQVNVQRGFEGSKMVRDTNGRIISGQHNFNQKMLSSSSMEKKSKDDREVLRNLTGTKLSTIISNGLDGQKKTEQRPNILRRLEEPSPQAPQMVKIVPNYGQFQRIASPYETVEKSSPVNNGQIKEVEKSSPVYTGQIITIDNSLPANAGQIIRNFNTNSEKSLPQNNGQIIKNSKFENFVAQKAGQIITVDNSSPINTGFAPAPGPPLQPQNKNIKILPSPAMLMNQRTDQTRRDFEEVQTSYHQQPQFQRPEPKNKNILMTLSQIRSNSSNNNNPQTPKNLYELQKRNQESLSNLNKLQSRIRENLNQSRMRNGLNNQSTNLDSSILSQSRNALPSNQVHLNTSLLSQSRGVIPPNQSNQNTSLLRGFNPQNAAPPPPATNQVNFTEPPSVYESQIQNPDVQMQEEVIDIKDDEVEITETRNLLDKASEERDQLIREFMKLKLKALKVGDTNWPGYASENIIQNYKLIKEGNKQKSSTKQHMVDHDYFNTKTQPLEDEYSNPGFSALTYVYLALINSPPRMVTHDEVVDFILFHFPYWRDKPVKCKKIIANVLSLNPTLEWLMFESQGKSYKYHFFIQEVNFGLEHLKANPKNFMEDPELWNVIKSGAPFDIREAINIIGKGKQKEERKMNPIPEDFDHKSLAKSFSRKIKTNMTLLSSGLLRTICKFANRELNDNEKALVNKCETVSVQQLRLINKHCRKIPKNNVIYPSEAYARNFNKKMQEAARLEAAKRAREEDSSPSVIDVDKIPEKTKILETIDITSPKKAKNNKDEPSVYSKAIMKAKDKEQGKPQPPQEQLPQEHLNSMDQGMPGTQDPQQQAEKESDIEMLKNTLKQYARGDENGNVQIDNRTRDYVTDHLNENANVQTNRARDYVADHLNGVQQLQNTREQILRLNAVQMQNIKDTQENILNLSQIPVVEMEQDSLQQNEYQELVALDQGQTVIEDVPVASQEELNEILQNQNLMIQDENGIMELRFSPEQMELLQGNQNGSEQDLGVLTDADFQ